MEVSDFDTIPNEILGEFFRRFFGNGSNEKSFVSFDSLSYVSHETIGDILHILNFDERIEESGWSDNLFNDTF